MPTLPGPAIPFDDVGQAFDGSIAKTPFDGATYHPAVAQVSIAFTGGVWTAITGVRNFATQRGRQDELSRMETGRLTMILDNTDGRFSPVLTSSPYFPNVKPWREIKVLVGFDSVTYPLFHGFIEDWFPVPGFEDQYVRVQAVDQLANLANQVINTTFVQQDSGSRVSAVLTLAGNTAPTDLDSGSSNIAAGTLSGSTTSALQHIEDVETIEQGLFWIGRDGTCIFRNANARFTRTESTTSQATFGGVSGHPFKTFEFDFSVRFVRNDVRITRTGGTEQVASDATSQAEYGLRSFQYSSAWLVNDTQALNLATLILSNQKEPPDKLTSITVEGGGDDSLMTALLGLEVGYRISVVRLFPTFGLSRDFWIEGIQWTVDLETSTWNVKFLLSAAQTKNYGVVGSGVVGTMTVGIGV